MLIKNILVLYYYFFTHATTLHTASSQHNKEEENDVQHGKYWIGTGIYDITGPAAQVNFMGYAQPSQNARGIHLRLRSRAFIISEYSQRYPSQEEEEEEENNHVDKNMVEYYRDGIGEEDDIIPQQEQLEKNEEEGDYLWMGKFSRGPFNVSSNQYYDDDDQPIVTPDVLPSLRRRDDKAGNRYTTSERNEKNSNQKVSLDPNHTICFVSIDIGMGSDILTSRVLTKFHQLFSEQQQKDTAWQTSIQNDDNDSSASLPPCHLENTSISGVHTHSAPAGFLQYVLYQVSSLGFVSETIDTLVEGIAKSLLQAYNNLQGGKIGYSNGLLNDANINRSPSSYLLNPKEEREMYVNQGGDTDKNMLLLKFSQYDHNEKDTYISDESESLMGILNWFAVHPTSMNNTNTLISGDNKGYASYLMEKHYNPKGTLPGEGKFVAAFASTNLGDVSPNTKGPKCVDSGLPCDVGHSTCGGMNEMCIASGPGKDMFESTEIIGRKQYEHALNLMANTTNYLKGDIRFRHVFVDMSKVEIPGIGRTCSAALGYSFAAGTTDGPGAFDFTQGSNSSNPFWNLISGYVSKPTQEQIDCQAPKPILLNTGNAKYPYDWDPESVPISVFQIGQLLILNVPAELTTMAGRRLRKAISEVAVEHGINNPLIAIAGLANSYTHYVTTFEEYQGQRYEAASTLYGPHTLSAYIQEFKRITSDLFRNSQSRSDSAPPDLSQHQWSLIPPVIIDTIAFGHKFGSVKVDVMSDYNQGAKVFVSFHSANPRNNQRIGSSFLTVERLAKNKNSNSNTPKNEPEYWVTKYVDGDWCTKFEWEENEFVGNSFVHITWYIPHDAEEGVYRICHFGTRKVLWDGNTKFVYTGESFFMSLAYSITSTMTEFIHAAFSFFNQNTDDELKFSLVDFQGCSSNFNVKSEQ